jgi:hypothetical protein
MAPKEWKPGITELMKQHIRAYSYLLLEHAPLSEDFLMLTIIRPRSPLTAEERFTALTTASATMTTGIDLPFIGGSRAAPATTTRRGRRPIHDWPTIKRLDAEFCRTYHRAPSWKERWNALWDKLGKNTPHIETLKKKLP